MLRKCAAKIFLMPGNDDKIKCINFCLLILKKTPYENANNHCKFTLIYSNDVEKC